MHKLNVGNLNVTSVHKQNMWVLDVSMTSYGSVYDGGGSASNGRSYRFWFRRYPPPSRPPSTVHSMS
ncbi:MAG: hypothetical protein ACKERG_04245 [Candidatus Hodgkinia cicadicola]